MGNSWYRRPRFSFPFGIPVLKTGDFFGNRIAVASVEEIKEIVEKATTNRNDSDAIVIKLDAGGVTVYR